MVSFDFEDFGNVSAPGPTLKLDDDVERVGDVGLDGPIGQVYTTLQNATGEAGEALLRGVCVNRGQRAGMSRVQELQKVEGFPTTNLSELRDGYACGWCELRDGYLSLVPHITSPQPIRRFSHLDEAEIIGRVTGVAMRIVGGGLSALSELPQGDHAKP